MFIVFDLIYRFEGVIIYFLIIKFRDWFKCIYFDVNYVINMWDNKVYIVNCWLIVVYNNDVWSIIDFVLIYV